MATTSTTDSEPGSLDTQHLRHAPAWLRNQSVCRERRGAENRRRSLEPRQSGQALPQGQRRLGPPLRFHASAPSHEAHQPEEGSA